jgi:signal transduction histidine kinase
MILEQIITALDGEIECHSAPGEGTEFIIKLKIDKRT